MKTVILIIVSFVLHLGVLPSRNVAQQYPFQDPTLSWDVRVDDLVGRLTLEEITGQINSDDATPAITRLGIKPYVWDTECLHGQQSMNATSYPQSIGLAASFSPDLLYNVSEAIAVEVRGRWNINRAKSVYVQHAGLSCFSPVINIMRHPLWGRSQETYGEDPYLSGSLVQGYVRGLQGNHPRYVRANAGCKHFDVHGGPEDIPVSRFNFNAKVSMTDWRMTFLPAFKMCVEAGSYSLMCSYNAINGIPACGNQQLLTNITRHEWGFKGYIVSDAGAIENMITQHHYTKTNPETAAAAIKAGCNIELGSRIFDSELDAMKAGLLTEAEIRSNVRPLMMTRLRLGEFDPEDMNPYNKIDSSVIHSPEHLQISLEAAMMSFVLLKNNGILPLNKRYQKLAVVGPFSNEEDQLYGDYTSNIQHEYTVTVMEGLKDLAGTVSQARGCTDTHCGTYNPAEIKQATLGADLVVVALGTGFNVEEEGYDRGNIDLPGEQLQLLQDALYYASGSPVILLLFNAGPVDVTLAKLHPGVSAIMECFFPGQTAGRALYNVLTASSGPRSVPAARLPSTWPAFLAQVPAITDYNMMGHTYRYYVGDPLYPFGFGLSYTEFLYTSFSSSSSKDLPAGQSLNVTVGIINTGKYDADEVVQLYLEWTNATVPVPKLQLVSYKRLLIKSGQHLLVNLTVEAERMSVWVENIGWTFIKGLTTLYAGGQQPAQRTSAPSNILRLTFNIV